MTTSPAKLTTPLIVEGWVYPDALTADLRMPETGLTIWYSRRRGMVHVVAEIRTDKELSEEC